MMPRRCAAGTGGSSGWGRPMRPPWWCLRGAWSSGWPLPWRPLYSGHTCSPGSSSSAPPLHSPGEPLLRRARVNVTSNERVNMAMTRMSHHSEKGVNSERGAQEHYITVIKSVVSNPQTGAGGWREGICYC